MKVHVRQTEGGYVVSARVPGTYPTKEAAGRAAWNMRHHGVSDPITPVASTDPEEPT